MDSEQLLHMLEYVRQRNVSIHSLLILRHGHIVLDAYFYPFAPRTRHDVASVTKSFTATLVGIAIDRGHIKSAEQPVLDLFPGQAIANIDENKSILTVQDLLTMRSGLECLFSPNELTLQQMMQSPNWVRFVLDLPMAHKPGTRCVYCSPAVHLLSGIITQTTGMPALDFARKYLFGPLGISDAVWPSDPQGTTYGWGSLSITPHDMAKLGHLYLKRGVWDSQQVVPSEWVKAATTLHTPAPPVGDSPPDWGYGYLWWLCPNTYSAALGRGGQGIFVVPEKDIVVVFTGGDAGLTNVYHHLITSFVIPAAKSKARLPANPDSAAVLESEVQQAAMPPKPNPPSSLPEMARRISGKTYELSEPLIRLNGKSFSLDFTRPDAAQMNLEDCRQYPMGLGDAYRFVSGIRDLPLGVRGSWDSDHVFVVDFDEIANVNRWRFTFAFQGDGDQVTVLAEEKTGLVSPRTVAGKAHRDDELR